MNVVFLYSALGIALFAMGLYALIVYAHLLRKILALNVMSSGVFLILIATAFRAPGRPDPVPHAMVLTGIVVAVSATALALALAARLRAATGNPHLSDADTAQRE